jgi:hypothetical protein
MRHIFQNSGGGSGEKLCDEKVKKFCNDFRSDAQALGLTRALVPRTTSNTETVELKPAQPQARKILDT